MDMVNIKPTMLKGEVRVPSSKSIAHRAIIAAFLSGGKCNIENIDLSEDICATIGCIEAMGAECSYNEKNRLLSVACQELKPTDKEIILDCGESGSTLRFFIPLALALGYSCRFIGHGRLMKRPLRPYMRVFEEKGISYEICEDILTIKGKLSAGKYIVDGSLSSQFVTGLLFALAALNEDSEIVIIDGEAVSRGYIDLTLSVMADFGIKVENKDYKSFVIKGGQKYKERDFFVEGDFSQAAFFLVAGALGCDIVCRGMNPMSIQGDRQIMDILKRTGAIVESHDDMVWAKQSPDMHGIEVDAGEIPDLVPILAVLFSFCPGESSIYNAGRLRIKESDRLKAISSELKRLGADICEGEDYLKINGCQVLSGETISAWNDHRIAMSMSIASSRCEGDVTIMGAQMSVKKSYPQFFDDYIRLGGIVKKES